MKKIQKSSFCAPVPKDTYALEFEEDFEEMLFSQNGVDATTKKPRLPEAKAGCGSVLATLLKNEASSEPVEFVASPDMMTPTEFQNQISQELTRNYNIISGPISQELMQKLNDVPDFMKDLSKMTP